MNRITLIVFAIVATVATSVSHALDQPKRKSGLWEMKMTTSHGQGPQIMQMCIDEKTDQIMSQQGTTKRACTKNDLHKEGSKYIGEAVCRFGDSTATTRSVVTGKFDSAYRVEATTTYDPPLSGTSKASTVIEAKWTGPCKSEQKPGDVIMPGMAPMNLNDLMKGMPTDKPQQ